jgi:hypothetical protein
MAGCDSQTPVLGSHKNRFWGHSQKTDSRPPTKTGFGPPIKTESGPLANQQTNQPGSSRCR